jgi:hypothetical protein
MKDVNNVHQKRLATGSTAVGGRKPALVDDAENVFRTKAQVRLAHVRRRTRCCRWRARKRLFPFDLRLCALEPCYRTRATM